VTAQPLSRHLLRARDLADARYAEELTVADMARAAGLSPSYFSTAFKRAFGESPHQYLLTRRLERAASLLRGTDYSVARICMDVGLASVGSFTSSFKRVYGSTPTAYRDGFPPAAQMAHIPTCILMAASRPAGGRMRAPVPLPAMESSFEEDGARVAT